MQMQLLSQDADDCKAGILDSHTVQGSCGRFKPRFSPAIVCFFACMDVLGMRVHCPLVRGAAAAGYCSC